MWSWDTTKPRLTVLMGKEMENYSESHQDQVSNCE